MTTRSTSGVAEASEQMPPVASAGLADRQNRRLSLFSAPAGIPLNTWDMELEFGASGVGSDGGNASVIFMETLREYTNVVSEAALVTHELGHTAGYEIKHEETRLGPSSHTGLLAEQPTVFTNRDAFDQDAQRRMRQVTTW